MNQPKLTKKEWREIYWALETKICAMKAGSYGKSGRMFNVEKWLKELRHISDKINRTYKLYP